MEAPKKVLNAEETREAVLEWFEDDNDWVVLGYIVDEVGYDQLTVSPKELQDVIDKIVAAEDLQLYHATRPSDSEFKGLFGGNPIPPEVDTKALSEYILRTDRMGLLTTMMIVPYPDPFKMPC